MYKKIFMVIILFFLLSGCSVFGPVKPENENKYVINIQTHPPIKKSHRRINLMVSPIAADPIYNTTQMAYTTKPYEIAYFAKNRWAETPPQMLQSLIIQTLQNTHHFYAVSSSPLGTYNYILNAQLIELKQVFYPNTSEIHLKMNVQLINATTNQLIASRQFAVVQATMVRTPYGGVMAANKAAGIMMDEIARFCLQKL